MQQIILEPGQKLGTSGPTLIQKLSTAIQEEVPQWLQKDMWLQLYRAILSP